MTAYYNKNYYRYDAERKRELEEFLANGGSVQEVDPNISWLCSDWEKKYWLYLRLHAFNGIWISQESIYLKLINYSLYKHLVLNIIKFA